MMLASVVAISRLHARMCPKCESLAVIGTFQRQFSFQRLLDRKQSQSLQPARNWSNWGSAVSNQTWRLSPSKLKDRSCQIIPVRNLDKLRTRLEQEEMREKNVKSKVVNVKTNVKNNVMLFKYERNWLVRGAAVFGVFLFIGCIFMADNVYLILCKDLLNADIPLKTRLYDNMFPLAAIGVGVLAGPVMLIATWILTVRTIKYIILHKGGKELTIVTYHPIHLHKKMTVPVDHVNCKVTRDDGKAYALITIKNKKFQYFVDKDGQFVNSDLFDCIVGVSRKF